VLGPWGTPQLVSEISESAYDDDDPVFTADRLELYFNSDRGDGGDSDIWVSVRSSTGDPWGAPQEVTELNSPQSDSNAIVSPDGLTLWLNSGRTGETEIYVSTRQSRTQSWSTPVLVPELNTAVGDVPCAVSADLRTIIVGSKPGGAWDLYQATRSSAAVPWGTPQPLTELNAPQDDISAWMSADGLLIYFDSERTGDLDIYWASRSSPTGSFGAIEHLGPPINTQHNDSDPWLSEDLRLMMFARGPPPRQIYQSTR
jgi:hypothetical protein